MEWWYAALVIVAIIGIAELIIKIMSRFKARKAPLSLPEFNALPLPKQVAYIWANGKLLGTRPYQSHTVIRYQLPAFYAEVYYNPETDLILSVQCFTSNNPEASIQNKLSFCSPAFV